MKTKLLTIIALLSLSSLASYADSCGSSTFFGAAVGTGAGALIGSALGGSDGAVLGAVVGGLSGAAIGHDSCHERNHHRHHHHRKHKHRTERHYHYYNEPAPVVCTSVCRPVCAPVVERRVYTQPVYVQRPCTTTVYREVCQPREVVYSTYNTCWGY